MWLLLLLNLAWKDPEFLMRWLEHHLQYWFYLLVMFIFNVLNLHVCFLLPLLSWQGDFWCNQYHWQVRWCAFSARVCGTYIYIYIYIYLSDLELFYIYIYTPILRLDWMIFHYLSLATTWLEIDPDWKFVLGFGWTPRLVASPNNTFNLIHGDNPHWLNKMNNHVHVI